ncbi:MAG TPA: peptidase [Candidatus Riflebacteria bacterium]|jgi:regulator of protease activity HflC (stomatin/prohibitin superfamily)|nr:peptidase [Candidatus Riflebacteria bacterium]
MLKQTPAAAQLADKTNILKARQFTGSLIEAVRRYRIKRRQIMFRLIKIRNAETGLKFKNGKLVAALQPGWHLARTILGERIDVLNEKDLFVWHEEVDQVINSGLLNDRITVVDLKDNQRAVLWIDDRFYALLGTGRQAIWTTQKSIRVEELVADDPRFEHRQLYKIGKSAAASNLLETVQVEQGETCVYYRDGKFVAELEPGFYAFWKNVAALKFFVVSRKEKVLDLSGQEIMTADKVSLRLNAVVNFKIRDAVKSVSVCESAETALYREAQLIMRAVIGARKIDEMLASKEQLTAEIATLLKTRADAYGVEVTGFGVKDIILPGKMREIMNRVVAAQKEAEANQIMRREETAATRSQCNTAKMLETNPTLMRLRELELIEKVAEKSKINLILGEKGLAEKLVNML